MTKFEVGKCYSFGYCIKRTEKTVTFDLYDQRFVIKTNERGVEYVGYTVQGWASYGCFADQVIK